MPGIYEEEVYNVNTKEFETVRMTPDEHWEYIWRFADFKGNTFSQHQLYQYEHCSKCKRLVHMSMITIELCPACLTLSLQFGVAVSFGDSRSKQLRKAVNLAMSFPGDCRYRYCGDSRKHTLLFRDSPHMLNCIDKLWELLLIISGWRSFEATSAGGPVRTDVFMRIVNYARHAQHISKQDLIYLLDDYAPVSYNDNNLLGGA